MQTVKCKAGDFFFDLTGRARYITDDEKAAQDIALRVLNELSLVTDRQFDKSDIETIVLDAIEKLQNFQGSFEELSSREAIDEIVTFAVIPDKNDPTTAFFFLEVRTQAGDEASVLFEGDTFVDLSHLLPRQTRDSTSKG